MQRESPEREYSSAVASSKPAWLERVQGIIREEMPGKRAREDLPLGRKKLNFDVYQKRPTPKKRSAPARIALQPVGTNRLENLTGEWGVLGEDVLQSVVPPEAACINTAQRGAWAGKIIPLLR
jgi:hypothetical protein